MFGEYLYELKFGFILGEDGLDLCLCMFDEVVDYFIEDGLLIVEVGESECVFNVLLLEVFFVWIEFKVGVMGVFVLECCDLVCYVKVICVVV